MSSEQMENLIASYGDDVYRFCAHLTQNHVEADDLYQGTFLKAIHLSHQLDDSVSVKSYLMGIAVNLWKNQLRKNKRRNEIAPQIGLETTEWLLQIDTADPLTQCVEQE